MVKPNSLQAIYNMRKLNFNIGEALSNDIMRCKPFKN